ncbi:hypothetical protein RUND412_006880 [Rhizina undulata]
MSPRQSALTRYYPILLPITIVAVSLLTYHIYTTRSSIPGKRLKRSNARRLPRRRNSASGEQHPEEAPDGGERLDVPDLVADQLVEAAMAAQEARRNSGAREEDEDEEGESEFSFENEAPKENQNLLNLLYLIAEDQAKRESYVHRGVTCNSCGIIPIRGIRYRCANCVDFDLCEHCETLESHPKTHLFYKVRIPAPFLGNPRQAQTPWYPGRPGLTPPQLPQEVIKKFASETGFEPPEIEALYEQFKCLAATEYLNDPLHLHGAISRQTFDKCFIPSTSTRPPPPNLIYDRMFAFYDTNHDSLIGFEEFVRGLAALSNKSKSSERLKRIFDGYDLDNDGYVDRKDFLMMFRAFYALSKDLVKDIVASMEDDMLEANQAVNVLLGSQPISGAFGGSIPVQARRDRKVSEFNEDEEQGSVVLESSDDRVSPSNPLVPTVEAAPRLPDPVTEEESLSELFLGEEPLPRAPLPPTQSEARETLEELRRREFFRDEGLGEDENLPEIERDVGSEVLYLVTQQGLNELLDLLFATKERVAIEARVVKEKAEKARIPPLPAIAAEFISDSAAKDTEELEKNTEKTAETTATPASSARDAQLEQARQEIAARGGEGRISFQEFEAVMNADGGRQLGFVCTWIDMASF